MAPAWLGHHAAGVDNKWTRGHQVAGAGDSGSGTEGSKHSSLSSPLSWRRPRLFPKLPLSSRARFIMHADFRNSFLF